MKICTPRLGVFGHFDLYRMPNEMWIAVFEALDNPSDLRKVVLTCKHFYSLAIRVLYRELLWMGPFLYVKNARFWEKQDPSMAEIPNSLTIAVSLMMPNAFGRFDPGTALVEADGSWRVSLVTALGHQEFGVRPDLRRLTFYASNAMYDAITRRVATFPMLRELIFHMAELPDTIYSAIKALPRLRHLSIQYCTLPVVCYGPDLDMSLLPITELTLWSNKGDSDNVVNSSYIHALYLCTARNLRILRIDWNGVTARFLSPSGLDAHHVAPPMNLTEVMLRFPQAKVWPTEDDDNQLATATSLAAFLSASPSIKNFSVVNRRAHLDLPLTAMPNLSTYAGSMVTALSVLPNRPVEHLEITDTDKRATDHLFSLPSVAAMGSKLLSLSLLIREWDDEILFALVSLFSGLHTIKIRYNKHFPSEQTLVSLGAQFLYRFPDLHTLHLYQTRPSPAGGAATATAPTPLPPAPAPAPAHPFPPDHPSTVQSVHHHHNASSMTQTQIQEEQGPGAGEDDDEVRELIVPWRKHCPRLREVRFVEGWAWRRAFEGDVWCKREVRGRGREWELC